MVVAMALMLLTLQKVCSDALDAIPETDRDLPQGAISSGIPRSRYA